MLSFYQRYFGKGQTQLTLKISVIFFFSQALRERKRLRYSTSERFCYCFALLKKLYGYRKHLLSHYGNEGWHAFVRQATEECRLDQVTFCWTKSKLWLLLFLKHGSICSHSLRLMCSIIANFLHQNFDDSRNCYLYFGEQDFDRDAQRGLLEISRPKAKS